MQTTLRGTTMQVLDVQLEAGESVFTESGGMAWMSPNIEMQTNTRGGLLKGLGRMMAGESLFLTTFTCKSGTGLISFANEFPGKIVQVDLKEGESRICQKDAFMCATDSVQMSMHFRKKLGAGFFGGEGFIMQKLTGPGQAWVEISGEVTEYNLTADQQLRVDPGHIAMYEPTVNYDVTMVKGVKNMFFGGEGLFLATVTGPGKVWLQSMPLANLATKIASRIPRKG